MEAELGIIEIAARFPDSLSAAEFLESIRWPNGPVCPHCGNDEKHYKLPNKTRRLWKCASCRKQFTVTVGTIFESSHVPLHKWLWAFYLICSSKKGISAHQLHRALKVTYKTAWFMGHRIRYAMQQPPFTSRFAGVVEVDETYVGGKERNRKRQDRQKKKGRGTGKTPVVTWSSATGRCDQSGSRTSPATSSKARSGATSILRRGS